jgi:HlyD family secretion protein
MEPELKSLRIDRSKRSSAETPKWASRWILSGILLLVLLALFRLGSGIVSAAPEVDVMRVAMTGPSAGPDEEVILNATGYIVAAHKIQVASKVLGRVAWIGVDKGDKVKEGQIIVRLEDDEYRAQLQQARGQLAALEAKLAELEAGSRPEEVDRARSELKVAEAELVNARINLTRTEKLVAEGVMARQVLDDARARFDGENARVASLRETFALVRIGPRREQIDAVRGQIEQARGAVAFYETQLSNTLIKAPVSGTILEREVEKGEFVTTSFVGERGAKGFVVSLADLNDLEVELDINQNDFAKLGPKQRGIVTTDAYRDRKYDGVIDEISPEANRQKATVQVKVRILNPDDYLRPEMNASVSFIEEREPGAVSQARPAVIVPQSAVRNNAVFVISEDKAIRREVKTGPATAQGLRIEQGLSGGEELILNPPEDLKDGDRVRRRQG